MRQATHTKQRVICFSNHNHVEVPYEMIMTVTDIILLYGMERQNSNYSKPFKCNLSNQLIRTDFH